MNKLLFSDLALTPDMLKNLESLGYHTMTQIQAKSLPSILNHQDIIARANTGSGKTAAFGIGLLTKINAQHLVPQALVICPTRELADQVSKEIRRLARFIPNLRVLTLCGGKPSRAQAESLRHGAHIIVGTPGRLQDHLTRKTLNSKNIQTLVLDEADRMLDMGFVDEIMDIIDFLPKTKQTLLFSATYPDTIDQISKRVQNNPIEISLPIEADNVNVEQLFYQVEPQNKDHALSILLSHHQAQSTIIFCKTKRQCDEVVGFLNDNFFHALAIHSDLEQKDRDEVLLQFANRSCPILVATDVASRGLDIKDLPMVINYDLPSSAEIYVHRIGRTGRLGKSGLAISLYSPFEAFKIAEIEEYAHTKVKQESIKSINITNNHIPVPQMVTLCINGGKKNKVRPGDILGALTGEGGLTAGQVGKIDIFDFYAYVAIERSSAPLALEKLQNGKIKGKTFKIRTF